MARLKYNGLRATLGASLTNSATSVTFAAALTHNNGTAVPTLAAGDYIPLVILDSSSHESEIVWLTAYTSGATTGTISRGQEGTTGVTHTSGDTAICSPTALDSNYAGVKVYSTASHTFANAAVTAVPWDTEDWDTNAFHDNATNNTRLTVPAGMAGKYAVSGTVASGASLIGRYIVFIQKNGTIVRGGTGEAPLGGAGSVPAVNVATEVDLAVGDYVELAYYQDSGTGKTMALDKSGLAMHRIG